jgi:hypothetical protein
LKQTFAVRFNRHTGRIGHIWGDRYWSRVLEGEPPEGAGEVDWVAVDVTTETGEISSGTCPPDGVSSPAVENLTETGFPSKTLVRSRLSSQTRLRSVRNRRHNLLAQRRQITATGRVCPLPRHCALPPYLRPARSLRDRHLLMHRSKPGPDPRGIADTTSSRNAVK